MTDKRTLTPSELTNPDLSFSDRVRSLRLPARDVGPPNRRAALLPWLLCAVFASTTAALALRQPAGAKTAGDEALDSPGNGGTNGAAAVTTATADDGEVALESKGYIIPAHQILVSPKVSGMIEKLSIEEGKRVKKGDVLAIIESIDYTADVANAKAALAGARERSSELDRGFRPEEIKQTKAELDESAAQREQLLAEHQRNLKLRQSKAVADRDFELSESAFKAMDRRVERLKNALKLMEDGPRQERKLAARAEVEQAEANLTKAVWRLDNCTIRAPVSGTILKKNAEEGNIVNPIAFNGSFSLCDMADLSDLEVDLYIQERDVARIRKGQKCKVRADAFPERVYNGVVARLMPIADRAKGAIPVRVKLTVPDAEEGVYLKPEMGAVVTFLRS